MAPIPAASVEDRSEGRPGPSWATELLGLPRGCQRRMLLAGNANRVYPERFRAFVHVHGGPLLPTSAPGPSPRVRVVSGLAQPLTPAQAISSMKIASAFIIRPIRPKTR